MKKVLLREENIFVINDFLSHEECDELIDKSELSGFADAPVTTNQGPVMLKEMRNNTRAMMDDQSLADFPVRARPPAVTRIAF